MEMTMAMVDGDNDAHAGDDNGDTHNYENDDGHGGNGGGGL